MKGLCRTMALTMLALSGSSCVAWHTYPGDPSGMITEHRPGRVRVITDSARIEMRRPWVVGDSIRGTHLRRSDVPVTVPIAKIEEVHVARFNPAVIPLFGMLALVSPYVLVVLMCFRCT